MTFWTSFMQIVIERRQFLADAFIEHLIISSVAILAIAAFSIPLGIVISWVPRLAGPVIGITGVLYTIPVLALFGFAIPVLGIGVKPALFALFIYGLLPLVRNTYVGITGVDPAVVEAARGMGSTNRQLLFYVQLPLALPVIIAGLRTVTVMTISIATIAAFIGAGGLGVVIWRGITTVNPELILAGSIPVALMAVGADWSLGRLERHLLVKTRGRS